jgi:hypothetical protein
MMIGDFHHHLLLAEISGTTKEATIVDSGTQHYWID